MGRRSLLGFLESCLRGAAQVALIDNPLTGALILAGLLLADLQVGTISFLGLLSSTLTARLLRLDLDDISAGLHGYNGLLVGAALSTFLAPPWSLPIIFGTVIVAGSSTIVQVGTTRLLGLVRVPALTFPFNFVTIPFFWMSYGSSRVGRGPALSGADSVLEVDPLLRAMEGGAGGIDGLSLLNPLLRGVSQLFLADSMVAGALILIGILLASRIAFVMALAGSAIGGLVGISLGADGYAVYHGLWGFNSFITAVAIGGILLEPGIRSSIYGLAAAVVAALLNGGLMVVLGWWGVPALTLSFCITTAAFMLAAQGSPVLQVESAPE